MHAVSLKQVAIGSHMTASATGLPSMHVLCTCMQLQLLSVLTWESYLPFAPADARQLRQKYF